MDYQIGQIFEGEYPPEAAAWCNSRGDCYIDEIEKGEDGKRRFQIVAIPEPTLDELKARKLDELSAAHEKAEAEAHVVSSLGFTIDANDRANRDIDGILKTIGDGTVMFCDYDNDFHKLNRSQCETLQIEIIQNAQSLYAQKWQYRAAIEAAESSLALSGLSFTFFYESFYTEATGSSESETEETTDVATE